MFMLSACAPVPATPERVVHSDCHAGTHRKPTAAPNRHLYLHAQALPTFTPIPPTPSETPTHTDIPPIIAMVNAQQNVNVRSGPGWTSATSSS
ncbi:MAG UNVERIFIED_CONTAM: hypothetical protein LVT10_23505 [Anaerolineae bacterium]